MANTSFGNIDRHDTDILIIGSGGAGLFAALHAQKAAPTQKVTIAVKGLIGKCGCTRMVQGVIMLPLAEVTQSKDISWTPLLVESGCQTKIWPGDYVI